MRIVDNTILITGGGSGIGLALAEEFLKLGNQVIVAGRSKAKLETAAKRGLKTLNVDMLDLASINALAKQATAEFPSLNVVIHNAGIMKIEDLLNGDNQKIQEETILTNLLGPIRLTDALLPHLMQQKSAVIMTVTSGLAFVPLAMTPTYSATKAAVHSYTQSLRYQLKTSLIEVLELAPPYVQTQLTGEAQAHDPNAMPLTEYIAEVMQILKDQPQLKEILVKRVYPLRFAAEDGQDKYEKFFKELNDRRSAKR